MGKITLYCLVSLLAAGLGSICCGYTFAVTNVPSQKIKNWINSVTGGSYQQAWNFTNQDSAGDEESSLALRWGWANASLLLGGGIGGLILGLLADLLGRRYAMLLTDVFTMIGSALVACCVLIDSFLVFLIGRFLLGICCGVQLGLVPMYLTEIAPMCHRGMFGCFSQFIITLSMLLASILGMERILGSDDLWPYLLGLSFLPASLQAICIPFLPESPQFLFLNKNDAKGAKKALSKLRSPESVDKDFALMQAECDKVKLQKPSRYADFVQDSSKRADLIICLSLVLSTQTAGMTAVQLYSTEILQQHARMSVQLSMLTTVAIMAINVMVTVVSMFLVDHVGRRALHLSGLAGMLCSLILLVTSVELIERGFEECRNLPVVFLVTFTVSFAIGPSSIPWFIVNECFEEQCRGKANTIIVAVTYLCAYVTSFYFPQIQIYLTHYTFLIFASALLVMLVFLSKFMPETRNKSVEEIVEEISKSFKYHEKSAVDEKF